MIKLTSQELEICYILSRIFNYYTSYNEMLSDINYDVEIYKKGYNKRYAYLLGREECFALFRIRQKYKQVAREVKTIKGDFTQKDLEKLFPITALYCIKTPLFYDALEVWSMEEGWNKEEFMQGIADIKEISCIRNIYIYILKQNTIIKLHVVYLALQNIL